MAEDISVTMTLINQVSKPLEEIKKSLGETATGFITGQLAVDAMKGSFNLLKEEVTDSIKKFDESEVAIAKLRTAIGGSTDAITEYASERQKVTRFDDEATVQAAALLGTYGLTEQQILKLLPRLQDMSAATGKDLSSAADLAGRSITTLMNGFKREGIEIDDSTSKADRLDQVLQQLDMRFKGTAENVGKVGAGSLVKLGMSFDDLKENVGKNIIQFPLFTLAVEAANSVLEIAKTATSEASEEYVSMAEDLKSKTLPPILDLNEALLGVVKTAPQAGLMLGAVPKFADPESIKKIAESFKFVTMEADATVVNVSKSIEKIRASIAKDAPSTKPKGKDTIIDSKAEQAQAKKDADIEYNEMKKDYERKQKLQDDYIKEYNENLDKGLKTRETIEKHEIARNKKYAEEMKGLWTDIGAAMAAGVGQGSKGLKESFKAVLNVALSFAEKYVITQQAVALASGWYNPAVWGQIALTAAAFETAKAGVQSFQTVPGQWKTVPGGPNEARMALVHGGERIGRDTTNNNTTNNNNNMGGVHLHLPESTTITTAGARILANMLDNMARNGHFDKAYNLRGAMA